MWESLSVLPDDLRDHIDRLGLDGCNVFTMNMLIQDPDPVILKIETDKHHWRRILWDLTALRTLYG